MANHTNKSKANSFTKQPETVASSLQKYLLGNGYLPPDVVSRSQQLLSIKGKNFDGKTTSSLRDLIFEVGDRVTRTQSDPDFYKKILGHVLYWMDNEYVQTKISCMSITDKTQNQNQNLTNPPASSSASSSSDRPQRKVVNITNNYFYGYSDSQKRRVLNHQPPTKTPEDVNSETSKKTTRRSRRRIFKADHVDVHVSRPGIVPFPSVCSNPGCIVCCSWFEACVPLCINDECPRPHEHICGRHRPNLNYADRRHINSEHLKKDKYKLSISEQACFSFTEHLQGSKRRRMSSDGSNHSEVTTDASVSTVVDSINANE
jgi:hypothetical protein